MDPFLGEIRMVGFNFAPVGWALCAGQLLSISQNAALFSLLGTTYGGNGTTTFGLPDLRSRVAINQGQGLGLSAYNMGEVGGVENVALNISQMPNHNHTVGVNNGNANQIDPTNNIPAKTNNADGRTPTQYPTYSNVAATGTLANNAVSLVGGSTPHNNLQPFLVVNFIIALQGVFPSRG
jgi:microcystin-dependent protein